MPAFLTTSGLQKFAVATPEEPVTVKYMAVGSGTGAVSENIQSLFNEVYRTEIPNPLRDEDNPRNLEFTGYIPTTVGGWTITELGLYDSSGVLVAYHLLDESIVKSSPDSALKTDMYPTFVLALSNASDVELFVSSSIEFDHEALTGRDKADSHPIKAITGLQQALDQKTTDLNTAVNDLNQTIEASESTTQTNLDNAVAAANLKDTQNVKLTGDQTVNGLKKFGSEIVSSGVRLDNMKALIALQDGKISMSARPTGAGGDVGLELIAGVTPQINFTGKLSGDGSGLNMLGWGQTTQNVMASRALGATYTNTTGKPIMVYFGMTVSEVVANLSAVVNGVQVAAISIKNEWSQAKSASFVVPNGGTYSISGTSLSFWSELR